MTAGSIFFFFFLVVVVVMVTVHLCADKRALLSPLVNKLCVICIQAFARVEMNKPKAIGTQVSGTRTVEYTCS